MNTLLHSPSFDSTLSQGERLELCSGRFSTVILAPESLGTPPAIHPTTGQPVFSPTWERKGTPSRAYVGVRPVVYASVEDETNEEEDDEERFVSDKEQSSFDDYRTELLSERGMSRQALRFELSSMGMEWND